NDEVPLVNRAWSFCLARLNSSPEKISSSSISRFSSIWYTETTAAINIEAAVRKKITAARENPASGRWVLMLVQQWENLATVVLQVFHFYRRVGNARDAKPAHQYFTHRYVVMT